MPVLRRMGMGVGVRLLCLAVALLFLAPMSGMAAAAPAGAVLQTDHCAGQASGEAPAPSKTDMSCCLGQVCPMLCAVVVLPPAGVGLGLSPVPAAFGAPPSTFRPDAGASAPFRPPRAA